MPTFTYAATMSPLFIRLLDSDLKPLGVSLPGPEQGVYSHYSGDLSVSDKGEILVWRPLGSS
jgi:hypothetical protein